MTVAVIFGGKSSEHTVSIATGFMTIKALEKNFDVLPVYVDAQGVMKSVGKRRDVTLKKLKKGKVVRFRSGTPCFFVGAKTFNISCAVLCMHGMNGEDGVMQGFLKSLNIPFSGSGVLASAVGLDKDFMKSRFKSENIPTLDYVSIKNRESEQEIFDKLQKIGYPLILKPARLGSSIGIGIASCKEEAEEKIQNAFKYDDKVVVERALKNFREVNCAILKRCDEFIISHIEEPVRSEEILSYKDKYCYGAKSAIRKIPACLEKETAEKIKELALKTFRALECAGVARVDFIIDEEGEVWVNEINTIPGSLAHYLFAPLGLNAKDVCSFLIEDAKWEKEREGRVSYEYEDGVIAGK